MSDKAGDNRMFLVNNSECWQNEGWLWLQNVFALADESGDSKVVLFSNWFATKANEVGDSRVTLVSHKQQVCAAPTEVTEAPTPWDLIRFSRGFSQQAFPRGSLLVLNWIRHILARTSFLLGRSNKDEDNFVKTSLPRPWQLLYLRPTGACSSWGFLDC